MRSLRRRLFLLLLAATGAIWCSAIVWISLGSRAELEHVLDTRLQEAARMVHSLVSNADFGTVIPLADGGTAYSRQLSCQVWSFDGRLVAKSAGAPDESLAEATEGFAERPVNGETWRVYTIVDSAKGIRVAVGDRIGLRDRLLRDLIAGLLAPALLIVPVLGLLIWIGLGTGLAPLRAMAHEIAARDGGDMRSITSAAPQEVAPLVEAINALFARLEAALHHERDITTFAAHELKTPLAGLKTQAQVALTASEPAVRDHALRQILASVDRTNRLVRQLLTLARLEASPDEPGEDPVSVGAVLREVTASMDAPGIDVRIDPALDGFKLASGGESLSLLLGNLHHNAVVHMGHEGTVTWRRRADGDGFEIEDDGPGIAESELPHITKRFYRGTQRRASGSGLGLTIAEKAAERIGAHLVVSNRDDRTGLRCSVFFSKAQ